MEVLFVLIIIGAIFAVAVSKHSKALKDVWAEAARRLDLRFQSGGRKAMRGSRPAMHILVQTKTVGKSHWTEYVATFKSALPFHIQLSPQGFFSEVTNSLLSRVDIEIGDSSFDSGIIIEGSDPALVREFLDKEVVHAIKRLVARFDQFKIDQRGVTVLRNRVTNTVDLLTADVELLEKVSLLLIHKAKFDEDKESMETRKSPPPVPRKEGPVPPPLPTDDSVDKTMEETIVPEVKEKEEPQEVEVKLSPASVFEEEIPNAVDLSPLLDERTEQKPLKQPEALSPVVSQWIEQFSEASGRYEFSKIFDTLWKDQDVSGEAILDAVETFSMDRVFGRGPGHRLTFQLGQLESGETLKLISDAPEESETSKLRSKIGEKIPFSGSLIRSDAFSSALFLKLPPTEESE